MLTLPSLQGVPRHLRTAAADPLAARLALALADKAPIVRPRRSTWPMELQAVHVQMKAWLAAWHAKFTLFRPGVHLTLGMTPAHELYRPRTLAEVHSTRRTDYTVFLGTNQPYILGTVFYLEQRWEELVARAPGVAGSLLSSALAAIDHAGRHALHVYTPAVAEYHASGVYWMGEDNEEEVIANYRDEAGENAPVPDDLVTREKFDKALPPAVTSPQALKGAKLKELARARGELGEIARLTLELRAACTAAHRRTRREPEMHNADENGLQALAYAAALRWNVADPMTELFDHWANDCANSEGYEEAYGWYISHDPAELPRILLAIERRFEIARVIERLLPLIATKGP